MVEKLFLVNNARFSCVIEKKKKQTSLDDAIWAPPPLPLGYNLKTLKQFENSHFKLTPMYLCKQTALETYTWVLILFLNCVYLLATVGDSNPISVGT